MGITRESATLYFFTNAKKAAIEKKSNSFAIAFKNSLVPKLFQFISTSKVVSCLAASPAKAGESLAIAVDNQWRFSNGNQSVRLPHSRS